MGGFYDCKIQTQTFHSQVYRRGRRNAYFVDYVTMCSRDTHTRVY